ncbi:MAG: hypothetical protein ACHQUA_02615 [Microgenomates group bacterium]
MGVSKLKKTSNNNGSPISTKLIVVLAIIGLVWYFSSGKTGLKFSKTNDYSAQLTSVSNESGMGTANKNFTKPTYTLNVSAFLESPTKGKSYFVWLLDGPDEMPDAILIGKMELSGDVYSLSYSTDKDYSGYKEVAVAEQSEAEAKEGKPTGEILVGAFDK